MEEKQPTKSLPMALLLRALFNLIDVFAGIITNILVAGVVWGMLGIYTLQAYMWILVILSFSYLLKK